MFQVKTQDLIALLRPKDWLKNVFILTPVIFYKGNLTAASAQALIYAFILFCLAASATYIINDIVDIADDRLHLLKSKTRPLAQDKISKKSAFKILVAIYLLLCLGFLLDFDMMFYIAAYVVLNLAYTGVFKKIPVLDLFCIAIGFILRIYIGAYAIHVSVSNFMIMSALCLSLHIVSMKRLKEINFNGTEGRRVLQLYSQDLLQSFAQIAITSALIFYAIFTLAVDSQLLITVPIVLLGIFRYAYAMSQITDSDAPIDALYKDKVLGIILIIWITMCCVL